MARFERLVIPGMPHHVTQRGNHRMNAFPDEAEFYIKKLEQITGRIVI
jgi:hypothetical protein